MAQTRDIEIADGPLVVLDQLIQDFDASLTQLGFTAADVCGVGVGVPGPVEVDTGRAVNPPIMPGWNEFAVTDYLRRHYDAPAYLDNDVNIMAIGEYAMHFADEVDDFLLIKVGSGIGSGIIAGRQLQRGGKGAAGDLGHVPVGRAADVPCRCGNSGCVEAVAGGAAILRQLRELGHEAATVRDVATMVSAGHSDANRLVRQAGRDIGEVVATTVNILNPSLIVLSGALADAGDELYAGVREVVYRRSTVLATRHLRIVHARLGADAGIVGATELVLSEASRRRKRSTPPSPSERPRWAGRDRTATRSPGSPSLPAAPRGDNPAPPNSSCPKSCRRKRSTPPSPSERPRWAGRDRTATRSPGSASLPAAPRAMIRRHDGSPSWVRFDPPQTGPNRPEPRRTHERRTQMSRFKYSYNAIVYYQEEIAKGVDRVARFGYDAIELVGEPATHDVNEINTLTGDAGIEVSSICSIWFGEERDLVNPSAAKGARPSTTASRSPTSRPGVGAPTIIVGPSPVGKTARWPVKDQEWGWAVEERAGRRSSTPPAGVNITLEPWNRYETYFLNRLVRRVELVEAVGQHNAGVMGDTFHMNIEEDSIPGAYLPRGTDLNHVHFADSNRAAPGRATSTSARSCRRSPISTIRATSRSNCCRRPPTPSRRSKRRRHRIPRRLHRAGHQDHEGGRGRGPPMTMPEFGASTFIWASPFSNGTLDLIDKVAGHGLRPDRDLHRGPRQHRHRPHSGSASRPSASTHRCAAPLGRIAMSARMIAPSARTASEYIGQCVDIAATLGAQMVAGPMYSADRQGALRRTGEARQQWDLGRQEPDAKPPTTRRDAGVRLAIEPLNRFETDLVNTVEQGERADQRDRPRQRRACTSTPST